MSISNIHIQKRASKVRLELNVRVMDDDVVYTVYCVRSKSSIVEVVTDFSRFEHNVVYS